MTLGFDLHPEARAELFADVGRYAERDIALDERFEVAVWAAIDTVARTYPGCSTSTMAPARREAPLTMTIRSATPPLR